MKRILTVLSLSLLLTACGKSGGGNDYTPHPALVPAKDTLKDYVEMFKVRYGVEQNYNIIFDTESETGGSGSGGTTVGVCRMWSDGYRDVLINKEWWLARTRYPSAGGYITNGTDLANDSSVETKSYLVPGSFQTRNNVKVDIRNVPNKVGLKSDQITGTSNITFGDKSCGPSVCSAVVYINEYETTPPGTYEETVQFGPKSVKITYTVVANFGGVTTGEIYRKVLIFHEMGHCSFNMKHNCRTVNDNRPETRCAKTNGPSDPGDYTESSTSNRPISLMYPVINDQAYFYEHGFDNYYEQELWDNRIGDLYAGYNYSAYEEEGPLYTPYIIEENLTHLEEQIHEEFHDLHMDDGIRFMK